jgi:hypothetical protein
MFINWPLEGISAISSLDATPCATQSAIFLFASSWKAIPPFPSSLFQPTSLYLFEVSHQGKKEVQRTLGPPSLSLPLVPSHAFEDWRGWKRSLSVS